jgi:hypothetical protein
MDKKYLRQQIENALNEWKDAGAPASHVVLLLEDLILELIESALRQHNEK